MILTCPDCATSYFVDDARIPAAGRTVKCTSCGARWQATKDEASFAAIADETAVAPPEPVVPPVTAQSLQSPPQSEDAASVGPAPPEPDMPFVPAITPKVKPAGEGRRRTIVLSAVATVVVALVATAVVLRGKVAAVLPPAAGLYAAVGLPAPSHDLTIQGVKAAPIFVDGRPALSVTGEIRNAGQDGLEPPPLSIHLVDAAGKTVAEKTATAETGQIPGGATRYFAVAFVDPPKGSHDLEVVFADKAARTARGERAPANPKADAGHDAPVADTHAAEPEEAKPLPAGSPDALDHHE